MKLSEVIAYRNRLEKMVPLDTAPLVHDKVAPLLYEIENSHVQFPELTDYIKSQYQRLQDNLTDIEVTADRVANEVTELIHQYEKSYLEASSLLYSQMMEYDDSQHILNRRFSISDDTRNFLKSRIGLHSNWQHAGMIVRPGREDWVNLLVGCDPLYLVDTDMDLIEPAVLRFNDQYQRRLRTYVVNEADQAPILEKLPDQQFGYCLIYNFFHYKSLEIVKTYLAEVYKKLKPGGALDFTFNNCDTAGATSLAERNAMCYTPGRLVLEHATNLGFELRQQYQIDAACTWVELRKPGTLTSLRGGQALAKINRKKD